MDNIIIIGAGDFGREIANVIERINANNDSPIWNLLGFVDDTPELQGMIIDDYPILGDSHWLENYAEEVFAICSIGSAKKRKMVIERFSNSYIKWAKLIDPDARLYKNAEIGEGTIICGGSILAINTKVRNHVIVNINCTLGHDDCVENYCVINPGTNVSGKVHIGECVDLGTGTKIIQRHKICPNTLIGAGAVVLKDILEPGTYVGIPAKRITKD